MRLCKKCRKELVRRDNETPRKFGQRSHCNKDCGQPRGAQSGTHSILTADDVRAIRASTVVPKEIAPLYGVSPSNISNIRARRAWAWLED